MKPSIPQGTRDFLPQQVIKRNFIFDTIKTVFQRYGYLPIETPAMEKLDTLLGKYGEEGDKLIFKILNSGDILKDIQHPTFNIQHLTEKALRYDLTVPFARYVVQHQNEITFPFKRYQIQPVWRADRPQKGRYREFFQCDADVIGSNSLLNEVELIQMIDAVYAKLGIAVTIKINNRKILDGIIELIGGKEKSKDVITLLDKYEKIGWDNLKLEWEKLNLSWEQLEKFEKLILRKFDNNQDKINFYKENLSSSDTGMKGIAELEFIFNLQSAICNLQFDVTLARGLNYYTGTIIEVKVNDPKSNFTGSICGGGRYDDLTGIFGLPNVSGVGISFGADRIYDVMEELNLFPEFTGSSTQLLFVNFGAEEEKYCLNLLTKVRAAAINSELYPDRIRKNKVQKDIAKQFDYANKKQIPFVAVVGSDEMNTGKISLKNMKTGEQEKLTIEDIIDKIK